MILHSKADNIALRTIRLHVALQVSLIGLTLYPKLVQCVTRSHAKAPGRGPLHRAGSAQFAETLAALAWTLDLLSLSRFNRF